MGHIEATSVATLQTDSAKISVKVLSGGEIEIAVQELSPPAKTITAEITCEEASNLRTMITQALVTQSTGAQ